MGSIYTLLYMLLNSVGSILSSALNEFTLTFLFIQLRTPMYQFMQSTLKKISVLSQIRKDKLQTKYQVRQSGGFPIWWSRKTLSCQQPPYKTVPGNQTRDEPQLPHHPQQSAHHSRKTYTTHIGDISRACRSGDQRGVSCWDAQDVSYKRLLLQDWET